MRIRSIKPEFWTSHVVSGLSEAEALHFIGLWSYAQDNGVGRDDARLLKAALYPLRDGVTPLVVEGMQEVLDTAGLILRFTENGVNLYYIPTWDEHQVIRKASKSKYDRPKDDLVPKKSALGRKRSALEQGAGSGEMEQGNGAGSMDGEAADAARQENPMADIMPLVRHYAYLDDGPPPDWSEDRDANIAKAILRKSTSVVELQQAITGMRLAVDRGLLRDWTPPVRPGEKFTLRILYNTKSGVLPTWTVALNALHSAHTHQDAPQRTKSRPLSLSDTPMPFGPQEAA